MARLNTLNYRAVYAVGNKVDTLKNICVFSFDDINGNEACWTELITLIQNLLTGLKLLHGIEQDRNAA